MGRTTVVTGAVCAVAATALLWAPAPPPGSPAAPQDEGIPRRAVGAPPAVTPIQGPSRLSALILPLQLTSLGQVGMWGRAPRDPFRSYPPAGAGEAPPDRDGDEFHGTWTDAGTFRLTGADVYRLACRSCHGPAGAGAPEEIPAILDPVRATSAELAVENMARRGIPVDREMMEVLAVQAEESLRQRLRDGGDRMPAMGYLSDDEVEALIGYLKAMAGVPGPGRVPAGLERSVARAGELLTKGTCHICHDATGPGGGEEALRRGVIPALSSFTREKPLTTFVKKVREGAPIAPEMGRGRMPVFRYVSEEEVTAAYVYLALYPPRPAEP